MNFLRYPFDLSQSLSVLLKPGFCQPDPPYGGEIKIPSNSWPPKYYILGNPVFIKMYKLPCLGQ